MSEKNTEQADLGQMYHRLSASLARYASRYFKKHQEVEDVVQEAFVRVLEAKHKRQVNVTGPYLYRTVHNLALKTLDKSDYKLTDTVGDLLPPSVLLETPTMEEQFESRERFELFCRAVRQLPLKCQRVFILRRVYGLSPGEIAERMGISIKTVEVHLTKAIVRCTDYMKDLDRTDADRHNSGAKKADLNAKRS